MNLSSPVPWKVSVKDSSSFIILSVNTTDKSFVKSEGSERARIRVTKIYPVVYVEVDTEDELGFIHLDPSCHQKSLNNSSQHATAYASFPTRSHTDLISVHPFFLDPRTKNSPTHSSRLLTQRAYFADIWNPSLQIKLPGHGDGNERQGEG